MFGPPTVQHVVVVSNFFTALSFLIVILRFYTRSQIVRIVSVEDYLIVVAMVSAFLFCPAVAFCGQEHPHNRVAFGLTRLSRDLIDILEFRTHLATMVIFTRNSILPSI